MQSIITEGLEGAVIRGYSGELPAHPRGHGILIQGDSRLTQGRDREKSNQGQDINDVFHNVIVTGCGCLFQYYVILKLCLPSVVISK